MIELAKIKDLEEIDQVALLTIQNMMASNIDQWTLSYPRRAHYQMDIEKNALYLYKMDGKIVGAITVLQENDEAYKTIDSWLSDNALVIHRVIVHPSYQQKKIAQKLFNFAYELGVKNKYKSIKIDTHLNNYKMRSFLAKNNFVEIGYLACINRMAYEKILLGETS